MESEKLVSGISEKCVFDVGRVFTLLDIIIYMQKIRRWGRSAS